MAFLAKKKIKGNEYYYIIENRREGNKVVRVMEKYIGRVDEVNARLASGGIEADPIHSEVFSYAADMAFYHMAQKLGIAEEISDLSGKRNQGLSVGMGFVLAAVNRILHPCSKSGLAEWYLSSSLSRVLDVDAKQLDGRRFWELMGYWDEEKTRAFQAFYIHLLRERYGIKPRCVVYDATNFFTFIDTQTESEIAQRGHCKSRRADLRIVALSLMVDGETGLPLFFETCPGNRADSTQFALVMERLKARYRELLGEEAELVMVFDRGNNSKENFISLDQGLEEEEDKEELAVEMSGIHFVAGLKRDQFREHEARPLADFHACCHPRLTSCRYLQERRVLYGRERNVVVCYNESLAEGQMAGILARQDKVLARLMEEQERLRKWREGLFRRGKKPSRESVEKKLKGWLSKEHLGKLIEIVWDDDENGIPYFRTITLNEGLEDLKEYVLGRTVLFTDQMDWTAEQVILAYRSSWKARQVFRRMKDPIHIRTRPIYHWTDQKIHTHIFLCVLAYILVSHLELELERAGFDLSWEQMIRELEDVRLIRSFIPDGRKKGVQQFRTLVSLTKTSKRQNELLKTLNLTDILRFR